MRTTGAEGAGCNLGSYFVWELEQAQAVGHGRAVLARHDDHPRARARLHQPVGGDGVPLVEDAPGFLLVALESLQHFPYGLHLMCGLGGAGVHHVEEQAGVPGLRQRGVEACHQVVGQVPDEAHRVRQEDVGIRLQVPAAHARVERGEELVRHELSSPRELVEER